MEDNEINQMVARDIIARTGAKVVTAENGKEEVALAEKWFDLIFDGYTDAGDGWLRDCQGSVLNGGNQGYPHCGNDCRVFEDDRNRCFLAGMNDFLMKPVTLETVAAVLERWFDIKGKEGKDNFKATVHGKRIGSL